MPEVLWGVRHGQSAANLAFAEAARTGALDSGVTGRDADVPLSRLGARQAAAFGRRLAGLRPDRLYVSTYRRARQTLELALREAPALDVPVVADHRLRDRETGVLELLTPAAVTARFPDEDRRRAQAGELDHRPPGGESLRDVAARVGEFLAGLEPGGRVLFVAHDATVLMARAVIEGLTDDAVLAVAAGSPVRNAALTRWERDAGALRLVSYNDDRHLQEGYMTDGSTPDFAESLRAQPVPAAPDDAPYDRARDHEAVREQLGDVIGILSARLEAAGDGPEAAALHRELDRWAAARRDLRAGDTERIAQLHQESLALIRAARQP